MFNSALVFALNAVTLIRLIMPSAATKPPWSTWRPAVIFACPLDQAGVKSGDWYG
jgi:hypothetical protein